MAAIDLDPYLKIVYANKGHIHNLSMANGNDPLWAMIKKDPTGGGKVDRYPVIIGEVPASAATFSAAQAMALSQGDEVAFEITYQNEFTVAKLDLRDTMTAREAGQTAYFAYARRRVDSAFATCYHRHAMGIYRRSAGDFATIGTGTVLTGPVLKISPKRATLWVEKNMQIEAGPSASPGSSLRSGTPLIILKVNEDAGEITFTANINTLASVAVGDLLYRRGDAGLRVSGLEDWIVGSGVSATTFFNVDRTSNPRKLAGKTVNGQGGKIYEVLKKACSEISEVGAPMNAGNFIILMPFPQFERLLSELQSSEQRITYKPGAMRTEANGRVVEVSFSGVRIITPGGEVDVYPSRLCQADTGWGLSLNTWIYKSMGPLPFTQGMGGPGGWLRDSTSTDYEGRLVSYPQLECLAPGYNFKVNNLGL